MRYLLFLLACTSAWAQMFPFPGPGRRASGGGGSVTPAWVQARLCEQSTSSNTITCAYSSNITAPATGSSVTMLVAIARWEDSTSSGGPYTGAITTSSGVSCTWQTAIPKWLGGASTTARNQGAIVAYCLPSSGGAETVQLTLTGSGTCPFRDLSILEYSGLASAPLDVVVSATTGAGGSSNACSSGATAPLAGSGELAIGMCSMWDFTQTWGAVSGWTNRATASNNVLGIYDSIRPTNAATTFSYALSSSDQWMSFVATFKPGT